MLSIRGRVAVPLLSALLLSWAPTAGADPEELRRAFLDLINAQRASLGLQPLVLEPELVRAAQAHADDMTTRQYAGFSSPEGRQTEDWARQAGYKFQLVTGKLAFTAEPPETIAGGWKPDSNRNSLFHPDVRDLGVGIGQVRGTPIYSFVLARSEESYLERYIAELYERQTLALQSVEPLREELLLKVNEARAGAKLHPLTRHPALDVAAQEHAEAVLDVIRSGRPLGKAGPLVAKVKRHKYRSAGLVGERIVTDALTPEQAINALLEESKGESSTLLGQGFTEMGTGLAFERTPEGFRIIWVQCLARPASKPTGADTKHDPTEGPDLTPVRETGPGREGGGNGGNGGSGGQ
ncbi:MAG TPA: CAP domain-containing protein [Thermoanaerobaculia bacterium]|nr:CAP domain-containing protein [Thermoanaerobaculia bacterium]